MSKWRALFFVFVTSFMRCNLTIRIAVLLFFSLGFCTPAIATRLPADLGQSVLNEFPDGKVRIDGSILTSRGELYLPIVPTNSSNKRRGRAQIEAAYPRQEDPDFVFYGNGWCYLRVIKRGVAKTVVVPNEVPDRTRKQVLMGKFPSDLIVPENFILPQSLKGLCGELSLQTVSDASLANPDFGKPPKADRLTAMSGPGAVFLTSLSSGKISLLDEKTLGKVADFPTEGTPSSMGWAEGRLYISDQAKGRILMLDPQKKQFIGQIDLPRHSAPKGIAVLPNGKLIYVAECGAGDIAVIEAATNRVLMRTKVPPGPSRIAITPNGNFLVVLNVPSGLVTVMSTLTQRVLGTISVGTMPTSVVISRDSHIAYVSNRQSNSISVIDLASRHVLNTIQTGQGPTGLALGVDNSKLYVANARENIIAIYDTKTLGKISELKLPLDIDFPSSLLLMPDGRRLLVSSESTDTVGVINLTNFECEQQIQIGHSSHDIIWVPR